MTITTGTMPANILPIAKKAFGESYGKIPDQASLIYSKLPSDMAFEEMFAWSSFGLMQQKTEGGATALDSVNQRYIVRANHVAYALKANITYEAKRDGKIIDIAANMGRMFADSIAQTRQVDAAMPLNRAFNSAYSVELGGNVAMCGTHQVPAGTTTNKLSVGAPLTEVSYEQAKIDIRDLRNGRGLKAMLTCEGLIVPFNLEFVADRLVNSTKRPDTANNDKNVHLGDKVIVLDYLTNATNWFVKTSARDAAFHFERDQPFMFRDKDASNTLNDVYGMYYRDSFVIADYLGFFGSNPA